MSDETSTKDNLLLLSKSLAQMWTFTGLSFICFMLIPIGVITILSTSDTIPAWFFLLQILFFLFMAFTGFPILFEEASKRYGISYY